MGTQVLIVKDAGLIVLYNTEATGHRWLFKFIEIK